MIFARLLGLGFVYGLGFMFIKSLFPTPIALLALQGEQGSEGNLGLLVAVYLAAGLIAGIVAAPLLGGFLLLRRGSGEGRYGSRLALSLALAVLMGLISGLLILFAYATGVLPTGGVLDPLSLIRSSNFAPGTPLLVAWTFARDLLPAGLTGLFLSPLGGGILQRLYAADRPPEQKTYEWEEM
ncbi:MAG: hypothetical protein AB1425_11260 [Actinomycetota bacterium]